MRKHRLALPGAAVLAALALCACHNNDTAPRPGAAPLQRLSVSHAGGGLVRSTPAGIDCGSGCSADFGQDQAVSLAAIAADGFVFSGWQGDCTGDAACTVTMSQARNVTAVFNAAGTRFELSVTRNGTGTGRVVSSPAGIDCGSRCVAPFDAGTQVELSASAESGARFTGWEGDCTGDTVCTVTMSQARNVTAGFALPAAPLGQWLLGDLHVHTDHSFDGSGPRQCCDDMGPGNVSVADQIGFSETLGLDFLPLTDHRSYDQHYDPLWESSALLLLRGEEANGSPHATVHGGVDTIVQGSDPLPEIADFANLQQSIWDAHAQGAVWVTAHPDDGELEDDKLTPNVRAAAVGIDLVEMWNKASNVEAEIGYAENRWNAGFRFGIAGASDDHFRELWAVAGPGQPTTAVFAGSLDERALLDALRAGRTVLSGDPLLAPFLTLEADFQGDGVFEAIAGDEVWVPAGTPGKLRVRAQFAGGNDVRVYRSPGRSAAPVAEFAPLLPEVDASYQIDIEAGAEPAWYRAEVRGVGPVAGLDTGDVPLSLIPSEPQTLPDQLRAATSPIFVSPAAVEPSSTVPPDIGVDDGAELALGPAGQFMGFPDVAVAGGVTHLVAEWHRPGATRVMYRRSEAGGSQGFTLDASASARFPRIAARGSEVWVVWQDSRDSRIPHRTAIYLRHSGDGGLSWDEEQELRAVAGRCEHPDIAMTPAGVPVVVWQEISAGNPFDVMVQRPGIDAAPANLSRAGKTLAAADPQDSRSARYPASVWPRLAVADDGRIAIAWQDNRSDPEPLWTGAALAGEGTDPDNWQILVVSREATAQDWPAAVALGAENRADRHPGIGFDADGTLAVVWDSKELRSSGANTAVLAAVSADGGASFGEALEIAPTAVGMSQYAALGRDLDGRLRAVGYDSRSADWRWRVASARRVDGAWQAAQLIPSRGINTWPATDAGVIAFASTRNAARVQRDATQQVFLIGP